MLAEFVLAIISLLVFINIYFRHAYKYWQNKGVGQLEPKFPLGNSFSYIPAGLLIGVRSKQYYDAVKEKCLKYGGIYMVTEPNLVVVDPDYIRDILAKDFQYFTDRSFYANERDDPVSVHLFAANGTKWRQLRTKLTPTFTSGKMKTMFQTVLDCSDHLMNELHKYSKSGKDVDLKDILARFTIDVIGSVAFGIDCNSFADADAEFWRMGNRIFEFGPWMTFKNFLALNMPKLSLKLRLVATNKDVSEFFMRTVRDVLNHRRKNGIRRKDFLQILIDLMEDEDNRKITFNEIVAQVFVFFIAGFDTSSSSMSFTLYELARNPIIQNKVRAEITTVLDKYNGEITYENLNEMGYLDQVIRESLRKYPPIPTLSRLCVQNYRIRDTNIIIEKGTPIMISPYGLHMDPEYFPNPEEFDPDRFDQKLESKRHPYVYLPFGQGPRNCIGFRFAMMQMKIAIISIVKYFKLQAGSNMKSVILDPDAALLRPVNPILVKITDMMQDKN